MLQFTEYKEKTTYCRRGSHECFVTFWGFGYYNYSIKNGG